MVTVPTDGYLDPSGSENQPRNAGEPTMITAHDPGAGGNYVFTIGKMRSGKSTLNSHMLRYLDGVGPYSVRHVHTHEDERQKVIARNFWIRMREIWASNEFPERNVSGTFYELLFEVTPKNKKFPPVKFGFVEISGEDLEPFFKTGDTLPDLDSVLPQLASFMENERNKIAFLFICRGDDPTNVDTLFGEFLKYLQDRFPRAMARTTSLAIVVSDPQKIAPTLKKEILEFRAANSDQLREIDFIRGFLKGTYAQFQILNRKKSARVAQFYVGEVRQQGPEKKPKIVNPDFRDAAGLFEWLYFRFSNRRIGKGFLQRTVELLEKLEKGE